MSAAKTKRPTAKPEAAKTRKDPAWWPARLTRLGLHPTPRKELSKPGGYIAASNRIREVVRADQAKHREEERARLQRIEDAKPRCPLCNQKLNEGRCAPCEEMKAMSYVMASGGAYEVKGYKVGASGYPNGKPGKVVNVPPKTAERCRYLGDLQLVKGTVCGLFIDDKTKAVYAQPVSP